MNPYNNNLQSDMDIDYVNKGYGYSVWYVPNNYKELQNIYKISHIPHITLETNLCLRDAYHIYHNASPDIIVKFQDKYLKFPSFYENDPMISFGWFVDVVKMTRRKLNWVPHMTLRYIPRTTNNNNDNNFRDKYILSESLSAPLHDIKCKIFIADTRSNQPIEWHTKYNYFNLKISHSYSLSFALNEKSYPISATSVDEYYGTDIESFDKFKTVLYDDLISKGVQMNEKDYINLLKGIEKELHKNNNTKHTMDIDNATIYRIR
jgi:hypothetical protein